MYGLPRRLTQELSSSDALHSGVGTQPASSLATGPSFNQGTKFIASYNSRSHLNVSGRIFTVRALITPVRVPTRCSFVLVDLPTQMPRSHEKPSVPSWAPDSFARTAHGQHFRRCCSATRSHNKPVSEKTLMSHQPWQDRDSQRFLQSSFTRFRQTFLLSPAHSFWTAVTSAVIDGSPSLLWIIRAAGICDLMTACVIESEIASPKIA